MFYFHVGQSRPRKQDREWKEKNRIKKKGKCEIGSRYVIFTRFSYEHSLVVVEHWNMIRLLFFCKFKLNERENLNRNICTLVFRVLILNSTSTMPPPHKQMTWQSHSHKHFDEQYISAHGYLSVEITIPLIDLEKFQLFYVCVSFSLTRQHYELIQLASNRKKNMK